MIAAASLVWLTQLGLEFSYWAELLPILLVFSLGLSMIVAPLTATVLADASELDAGIASGVNNAVARIAGLLGIAVVGAAVAGGQQRTRPVRVPSVDGDHGRPHRHRRRHRTRRDTKADVSHERCGEDPLRPRDEALRRA